MRRLRSALAACAALALLAPAARGQAFLGPDRCLKCHKKLATPSWKFHREAGAQLEPAKKPNAAVYAAATGGNPKAEACRKCHAPDAAAAPPTVSCESCHGPGKDYNDPHQERAFYDGTNLMGLVMLYQQPGKIAQLCMRCHVLTTEHKAIADLGHPTGDTFKVGVAFDKMRHWPSAQEKDVRPRSYGAAFAAEIDRAAAPQLAKALKATRPPTAARPPAGGAAPAAAAASGAASAAAMPAAGAPAAPEGGVLAGLLAELRQEGVDVRSSNMADAPSGQFVPAAAPPRPAPRTAPVPASGGTRATAEPLPVAPQKLAPPKARDVYELRGRAAERLAALLRAKARIELAPPSAPARFAGPDGELLALQDEVLALALEALRKKPPATSEPGDKQPSAGAPGGSGPGTSGPGTSAPAKSGPGSKEPEKQR